jgi:uracil DNA glycosylase
MRSSPLLKPGAITKWRGVAPALESVRTSIALADLEAFSGRYVVLPKLENVFDIFRMVMPEDTRVVIVAQSPYPGSCPTTGIPYACGPAFLPARGCATTPVTLKRVMQEACRGSTNKPNKPPRDMLLDWIDQGVVLLNSSMTIGKECPKHLEDHSIVWQEIMHEIIRSISDKIDPVFLLVGRDAWKFEGDILPCVATGKHRVIKVSHPVAIKDTSTPWLGSGVFDRVSGMLIENGEMPIVWVPELCSGYRNSVSVRHF